MKSIIQSEAEKAAKKIREALEEFHKETGMAAEIEARWVSLYQLSRSEPTLLLDRVEVQPVLPGVRV